MNKLVNKTVNVLARFGDRLERYVTPDDNDDFHLERSGSNYMLPRTYSSDNLAASPGNNSFSNYRQKPMRNPYADRVDRPPYGTGIGAPLDYEGGLSRSGSSFSPFPGSVGYAPDYYVAERRQVELVPAPPPRVIQQRVPYPVPVDRPVPQPYPVNVPRPYPVDRPVPVPVPSPVHINRPVPYPVPVPVPSPPPPPICVPYPVSVPTPVPYYLPVASPPVSSYSYQHSYSHNQQWSSNSSSAVQMNPYGF